MRILITGSTGFLGNALSRRARVRDFEVIEIPRWSAEGDKIGLEDQSTVSGIFDAISSVDACVHCAGKASIEGCERDPRGALASNVLTCLRMAEQCSQRGCDLVMASTDYVFDGSLESYEEASVCKPLQVYGMTKFVGEEAIRLSPRSLVVRLPLLYDLGSSSRGFVRSILDNVARYGSATVDAHYRRYPTYVDDAADAILDLVRTRIHGLVHVSAPEELSKLELVETLLPLAGAPPGSLMPTVYVPSELRPTRVRLKCRRLEDWGFSRPRSVAEVITAFDS